MAWLQLCTEASANHSWLVKADMDASIAFRDKVKEDDMNEHHSVQPVPEGYRTVTPWMISRDSAKLIGFLEKAFGAKEQEGSRVLNENGSIGHVEVKVGDSVIMLFDAQETWPDTVGFFRLYVGDADGMYQQALEAGATSVTNVTELFWGDRVGRVRDPFGNLWWIQTHVTDVAPKEMAARMQSPAMVKAMQYVQQSLTNELNSRK